MSGNGDKIKWATDHVKDVPVRELVRGCLARASRGPSVGKFVSRPRMSAVKASDTGVAGVETVIAASTLIEAVTSLVCIGGKLVGSAVSGATRLGVRHDVRRNYLEQELRSFGRTIPLDCSRLAYVTRNLDEKDLLYLVHGQKGVDSGASYGRHGAEAGWEDLMAGRFDELLGGQGDSFLTKFSGVRFIPSHPEWSTLSPSLDVESLGTGEDMRRIELGGVWERYGVNPRLDGIHVHDFTQRIANATGNLVFFVEAKDLVNLRGEGSQNFIASLNKTIPGAVLFINRMDKLRLADRSLYDRWRGFIKRKQRIGIIVTSADAESSVVDQEGAVVAAEPKAEEMREALTSCVGRRKRERTGYGPFDDFVRYGDLDSVEGMVFHDDRDYPPALRANLLLNLGLLHVDRALCSYEGDKAIAAARAAKAVLQRITDVDLTDVDPVFGAELTFAHAKADSFLVESHTNALRLLIEFIDGGYGEADEVR